jgi:hypothetical protein
MRTNALILAFLLVAGSAAAQESRRPRADYSRDTLMRMFVAASPEDEPIVRYENGGIELRALGANFRAQVLAPLSGSTPGSGWPDPFSLTRTQIATSQRAWRTRRDMSRELRRIELTQRARVSVTTR